MSKHVGVWLNHKQACLVILSDQPIVQQWIDSEVEGKKRSTGRSRGMQSHPAHEATTSDTGLLRQRNKQLSQYYKQLVEHLKDAEKIYIFGPGIAKLELQKALSKNRRLTKKIVGVEVSDQLTDRQITAKVKNVFHHQT